MGALKKDMIDSFIAYSIKIFRSVKERQKIDKKQSGELFARNGKLFARKSKPVTRKRRRYE